MSKKSNVQKIQNLTKKVNNLNRRLNSNAPVAISNRNGNKGSDYYQTAGCERISDVTVLSTSYNCVDVFINPANANLFPWLSGIASKYDLYHFKKLIFRYKPSLPTSEAGNIYLGVDYNTLDPAPPSSIDLCQLTHWTTNVVWKPNSLNIDLKDVGWLYTRSGSVPNADYKTYDLGRFFLATENISFASTVGYVEVEYQVEFKRRQPDYVSSTPATNDVAVLSFSSTTAISITAGGEMSLSSPNLNTATTEWTVGASTITINQKGIYQLSITANTNNVTIRKNGSDLIHPGAYSTLSIVELNNSDVIDVHYGGTGTGNVFDFNIVKLN